jgi:uncharacterized protein (DUF362 family)
MKKNLVAVCQQKNYNPKQIEEKIQKIFGYLEVNEIFRNKKVLIKPNCTGIFPPSLGRTTHPSVLEALVLVLKDLGAKICIGESSTAGTDTKLAFKKTGVLEVAKRQAIKLIDFKDSKYIYKNYRGSVVKNIGFPEEVYEQDVLISLAKLKTNYVTTISCGIKNFKGLLTDEEKKESHRIGLTDAIIDLYEFLIKNFTCFSLVDGILGSELYEPKRRGILIASLNSVNCDAVCAQAMGINPRIVRFLNLAKSRNLGEIIPGKIGIIGDSLDNSSVFKTCTTGLAGMAKQFNIKIIDGKPCSSCVGGLFHILNKVSHNNPQLLKNLKLVVGSHNNYKIPADAVIFGNCACRSGNNFKILGCPPTTSDFIKCLKK